MNRKKSVSATHTWNLSPQEAVDVQNKMRGMVSLKLMSDHIRFIAGADVSFNLYESHMYAGLIVLDYVTLEIVDRAYVKIESQFPYISGLLSFREIPGLIGAWKKIRIKPDVIIVDGQGITHPRRLGIASHFGVLLQVPTIGCAKSMLYGKIKNKISVKKNSKSEIIDPNTGEILGYALRTKEGALPVYISPGHALSAIDALSITNACVRKHKIPEPTRLAHIYVNSCRKGEMSL